MATLSTRSPRRLPRLDLTVRGRTVAQLGPLDASVVYGRFKLLRQYADGRLVKASEVKRRPWLLVSTVVAVLVCTPRGSVMVQFRRWPKAAG